MKRPLHILLPEPLLRGGPGGAPLKPMPAHCLFPGIDIESVTGLPAGGPAALKEV
ncbi:MULTISPECIES: hypothetical protein [Deinococcus]|uniref:hypothetical protein n=1 Tax=Deinococcus TaxID=1298 RepID=UPI0012D30D2C|nr:MULTISPECIES: hypothetical protein [Deinococcus]